MDPREEVGDGLSSLASFVKRKRTKRKRIQLVPPAVMDSPSSSSVLEEPSAGCLTEEDEDMANCLILLAQGRRAEEETKPETEPNSPGRERFKRRRRSTGETAAMLTADGSYVYECKTCNKIFPSFQALGGHRASHKKPKVPVISDAPAPADEEQKAASVEDDGQNNSLPKKILGLASVSHQKQKVHECGICGAEFHSGQALGGHMRRHRPLVPVTASTVAEASSTQEVNREKSPLELDLNLPAGCDDELSELDPAVSPSTALSLSVKQPAVLFSSSLVDCHH